MAGANLNPSTPSANSQVRPGKRKSPGSGANGQDSFMSLHRASYGPRLNGNQTGACIVGRAGLDQAGVHPSWHGLIEANGDARCLRSPLNVRWGNPDMGVDYSSQVAATPGEDAMRLGHTMGFNGKEPALGQKQRMDPHRATPSITPRLRQPCRQGCRCHGYHNARRSTSGEIDELSS